MILNTHVVNYSSLVEKEGLICTPPSGSGTKRSGARWKPCPCMAAERTPGLLRDPPPFVFQKELGDFAVTYELNVHTDRPQKSLQTYTELHRNIRIRRADHDTCL